jgi:hypothetical protein
MDKLILMAKNKKIVYGIIVFLMAAAGVFIWNNYQIEISERPIKPIWPPTPPAELIVIVTDAKTEKPIEGAMVEVKEMVSCPAMEGYPCPQGLIWQTKTDKQGQALFTNQTLKEYVEKNLTEFSYFILGLNISASGYLSESKEILYSPNKELVKRDFGLTPPGDQRVIYNPEEKVFPVELLRLDSSQSPPGYSSGQKPSNKELSELILEAERYGYVIGDIVQIKTGQPALGDVIVYDPFKNKSMCLAMGPQMALGKIVGLPGETFSLQNGNLKIRTEIIEFGRDYSQENAVFGGQKYENLVDKNITLQIGEYLIDRWVGLECFAGELDETGSSISYNRFTVNEEAITGIITKKIGHDKQAEEEFRSRIY